MTLRKSYSCLSVSASTAIRKWGGTRGSVFAARPAGPLSLSVSPHSLARSPTHSILVPFSLSLARSLASRNIFFSTPLSASSMSLVLSLLSLSLLLLYFYFFFFFRRQSGAATDDVSPLSPLLSRSRGAFCAVAVAATAVIVIAVIRGGPTTTTTDDNFLRPLACSLRPPSAVPPSGFFRRHLTYFQLEVA